MEKERLHLVRNVVCDHFSEWEQYTRQRFDILLGFEFVETRCRNCHKILATKIIGFGKSKRG